MAKNQLELDETTKALLEKGFPMGQPFGLSFEELKIYRGLSISKEQYQGSEAFEPVRQAYEHTVGEGMYCTPGVAIAISYAEHRSHGELVPVICSYDYKDTNLVCLLTQESIDAYIPEYLAYISSNTKTKDPEWSESFRETVQSWLDAKKIHAGNLKHVAKEPHFTDFFKKKGFDGLMTLEGGERAGSGIDQLTSIVIFDPKAKLVGVETKSISRRPDFEI